MSHDDCSLCLVRWQKNLLVGEDRKVVIRSTNEDFHSENTDRRIRKPQTHRSYRKEKPERIIESGDM
jgi:hypothetical protein